MGAGHEISPPAPMMPPAIGMPLDQQAHGDAAVCQPLATSSPKKLSGRGLGVGVERLGVALAREGHRPVGVELVLGGREALPDAQVVEVEQRRRPRGGTLRRRPARRPSAADHV